MTFSLVPDGAFKLLLRQFPQSACLYTTKLVPKAGLEPAQPKLPPPQDGVSTNSTTWANSYLTVGTSDPSFFGATASGTTGKSVCAG